MDRGQKETNRILKDIEERINAEYSQAVTDIEEKLNDYFARYKKKDETWQTWVAEGSRTEKEYEEWKMGQLAVGKRWSDQKDVIAHDLANANEIAKAITREEVADVYARNYNYATYEIEKDAHIDTSFTQYSKESVNRLMADDPDVLPGPGKKVSKEIAEGKAVRWNKQQLQSVMIQGILQGESIPNLATRLANAVGDKNRKAAIRNARTMATGAQNAGRVAAYKRAESKGVELEQMWLATMDNRTRHSHRWLDGEVRPVGEPFSNGCEYPGDPKGDPAEIYNCRCSLRGVVKGLDRRSGQFRDDSKIDGMSYDEWRNAKPVSQDIQRQEKVGKAIKQKHINEYKHPTSTTIMNDQGTNNHSMGTSTLENKLKEAYEYNRVTNNLNLTPYKEGLSLTSVDLKALSSESANAISSTIAKLIGEYDTPLKFVRTAIDDDEKIYFMDSGSWAVTFHDYRAGEASIVINKNKCGNYERMVNALDAARDKKKCIDFKDGTEGEYVGTHEFAHSIFNVGEKLPTGKQVWSEEDFTKLNKVRKETEKLYNDYKKELSQAEKKWMAVEEEATRTFDLKKWEEAAKLREEYDTLYLSKYALTDVDEFMAEAFTASKIGKTQNKYTEAVAKLVKDNYGR